MTNPVAPLPRARGDLTVNLYLTTLVTVCLTLCVLYAPVLVWAPLLLVVAPILALLISVLFNEAQGHDESRSYSRPFALTVYLNLAQYAGLAVVLIWAPIGVAVAYLIFGLLNLVMGTKVLIEETKQQLA